MSSKAVSSGELE